MSPSASHLGKEAETYPRCSKWPQMALTQKESVTRMPSVELKSIEALR